MKDFALDQVVGFDLEISGARIEIRCDCGKTFDSPQGSLGGLPLAVHVCSHCAESYLSSPQTSLAVLRRFIPERGFDDLLEINRELTDLAENWHRRGPWPGLLDADGVDLGPPMERELQAHLLGSILLNGGGSR